MNRTMLGGAFCLAALWLSSTRPTAQTLVKDIGGAVLGPAGSSPRLLTPVGNEVFFGAGNRAGRGIWVTDGTAAGTRLAVGEDVVMLEALSSRVAIFVRSARPGATTSSGFPLSVGRTDGTSAGTWSLPVAPGQVSALARIGGEVALMLHRVDSTAGPVTYYEVWATDGSVAGTRRIASLSAGSSVGRSEIVAAGDRLFVILRRDFARFELWSAQGTSSAFQKILEARSMHDLTALGDRALFVGVDLSGDAELFSTDGTIPGTVPLDLEPGPGGSAPGPLLVQGTRAYFSATTTAFGREPWVTDGTVNGTTQVADLNPGPADSLPVFAGALGGEILLSADDGNGQRLYAAAAGGTPRVLTGAGVQVTGHGVELGGALLFSAGDQDGSELWRSDGTSAGTFRLADISPGPASSAPAGFTRLGGEVLFSAAGANGKELWVSDGTAAGTRELIDLFPGSTTASSYPDLVGKLGDRAYFTATDADGRELWATDGTDAGTSQVIDLEPGYRGSSPSGFHFADDFFVFDATTSFRRELWGSDGTAAGTRVLGPPSGPTGKATTASNEIVYPSGPDVWITDGTPAGTRVLKSFGGASQAAFAFTSWKGSVYFSAPAPAGGLGVWVTDGTPGGTRLVWVPSASSGGVANVGFTGMGDEVFFLSAGSADVELWATDGTSSGTRRVGVVAPSSSLAATPILAAGNRLFFFYRLSPAETRLFVSDGVAGVTSIGPSLGKIPTLFDAVAGGRVVYAEKDGDLWSSDGSFAGTVAILSVGSRPLASIESYGKPGVETLFFRAPVGSSSQEMVTDGTGSGTRILPGGEPLGGVSNATGLRLGATFLYLAVDRQFGAELFSRPISDFDDYAVESYVRGCGSALDIELEGVPRASAAAPFSIVLSGAPAGAPAWLLSSPERAYVRLGTCVLGLGGSLSIVATTTDAAGTARVSFAPSPALIDLKLDFQYAVLDPAGAYLGLSLTPALEVVGGP